MRKKLTTYIEQEYINKLKRMALEHDTTLEDVLNGIVKSYFDTEIICICDFNERIKTKKIQYGENIFEADYFEDLETAVKFYKEDKEVFYIEHDFFEVITKGDITELIPLGSKDFLDIGREFVKSIEG